MSFTNVFGGSTIFPSDVSYLALALSADVNLSWPLETTSGADLAARIIDVTPTASGWSVYLPDATRTGAGQTILFNNVSASYTVYVKDYAGNTLATLGTSSQWQFYLSGVATAAGTWRVFQYGAAGSGAVQPSAYAGYGLTVTGSTLSTASPVTTFSTTGTTLSAANRAGVFIWTGSGSGTLNLPAVATAGNNYFVLVRNAGGGVLTLDPAGSETINGDTTLTLDPKDSAVVVTDGTTWYTIGLGQDPVFAFDYTSISVTGGTYTLSGSELNRIAYKFVGVLTSNQTIVVPSTIQQYWVNNGTTGSYTLGLTTSGGATTTVGQSTRGIYYCDGSDIILADTASIALPLSIGQGGTGGTTASAARLSLGITAFADAIVTATAAASVRTTISAAAAGANSDITSLSALSTPLSAAQGGTGLASYAVGDLIYASGATALSKLAGVATGNALLSGGVTTAPAWGKIGLTTHISGTLALGNGGTGQTTANAAFNALAPSQAANSGKVLSTDGTNTSWITLTAGSVSSVAFSGGTTGLTSSGGPITTSGTITLGGTLVAANGGTGLTSYAIGDLIYASASTTLDKLAAAATGNALLSGTAPAWGKIGLTTHVSGTLPVANGGTGITALGANVAAFLGTPSSANLAAAVTDGNGSGALVFATSPALVTPALGTPTSGDLSSCTFPALSIRSYSNVRSVSTAGVATCAYTADQVVMQTAGGTARVVNSLSATLNLATTNAVNGRESPGTDAGGWWYVYAISNGTTNGVWLAASATAPTLPSGYTYYARIGVAYNNGVALFGFAVTQRNNEYAYAAAQAIAGGGISGNVNTPTYTAYDVVSNQIVPATACGIQLGLHLTSAGGVAVAMANNGHNSYNNTTNPPPMMMNSTNTNVNARLLLESDNVYYAFSSTNAYLRCYGFTDAI